MIDTRSCYNDGADERPRFINIGAGEHLHTDLGEDNEGRQIIKGRYGNYDDIDPHKCKSMDPEQYLVCHNRIWAFVLKTRQWGKATFRSSAATMFKKIHRVTRCCELPATRLSG